MKILLLCLNAFETMEFSPFVDVLDGHMMILIVIY